VRSANNIAEAAAVRHATWANDLGAVSSTIERLGHRALRQSGGNWQKSQELFENFLNGVSNRLGRSSSPFGIEIQPAALRGGERVPAFVHLHRGGWDSPVITERLGNPRLFAFPGSRRLDAGIFDVTSAANAEGLRPLVAGFDITLDASKPSIVSYYQRFFGNIPIYDIRLQ